MQILLNYFELTWQLEVGDKVRWKVKSGVNDTNVKTVSWLYLHVSFNVMTKTGYLKHFICEYRPFYKHHTVDNRRTQIKLCIELCIKFCQARNNQLKSTGPKFALSSLMYQGRGIG